MITRERCQRCNGYRHTDDGRCIDPPTDTDQNTPCPEHGAQGEPATARVVEAHETLRAYKYDRNSSRASPLV